MPTYLYKCTDCGHRFEHAQGFHDDPLEVCPDCGGVVRRVIGNVGVSFKGSGFYRTDSQAESRGKAKKAASSTGAKSDSGDTSAKPETSSKGDTSSKSEKSSTKESTGGSGSSSGSSSSGSK